MPHHPDPFLTVRIENAAETPSFTGWCAGFENEEWRARQLAAHLIEWLPEFALRYTEWTSLNASNAIPLLAKAVHAIYQSPKFQSRGEFGEILLHAMIRQHFHTVPAISKYFYKDSANDTVKGFDAVHVVPKGEELELWLGEVKFYEDLGGAISAVVAELEEHSKHDYLRSEFATILNKLDPSLPYADKLKRLLHRNTSLDEVFARICIPVLITYESSVLSDHSSVTTDYEAAFAADINASYARLGDFSAFAARVEHLFMPPVVTALDEYGIPFELGRKIAGYLGTEDDLDVALDSLKALDPSKLALHPFEERLLRDAIDAL